METVNNSGLAGLVCMMVGGLTFAMVAIIITLVPWFTIGYFFERKMLYFSLYELFAVVSFYASLTIGVLGALYLFGYFKIFNAISSLI